MTAKKNPQFAYDLLAVAHQDLKAAIHLYNGGYYPQAVFSLQQSVEKGLKSYSVASGMIDENESQREISHKTLKIYEKSIRDMKNQAMMEEEKVKKNPILEAALQPHFNFSLVVEKLDETLGDLTVHTTTNEKSLCITEGELNKVIKTLQDIHRDANREKVKIRTKIVTPSEFRQEKKEILNFLETILAGQPERLRKMRIDLNRNFTIETYEKQMREILLETISPMEILGSFFELSKIFQPHAVSRYPKSGFNPLQLYTMDFPLIKSFLKLANITERVLNQIDDLYQKADEKKK